MAEFAKVRAHVKGEWHVRRNLEGLAKDLDGQGLSDSLFEGARIYAKIMKMLAPRRSGGLQDAIYAYSKYRSDYARTPVSRKMQTKPKDNEAFAVSSAPHSFLVELGTKHRITTPKKGRAIRLSDGRIYARVSSGRMPAHPFWRPAFNMGADQATTAVQLSANRLIAKYD